ncbi:hypothetical protein [Rickettsiella massiliensis]|uniref:hypothetical protein n=1 Tax=Rickettsiella massiliensis TaxID=676517 RepID=UPI0002EC9DFA|nr:hypothetical protein [Rickettsiella massiliensis]
MKLKKALLLGAATAVLALPAFAASKMPADPSAKASSELTEPSTALKDTAQPPKGQCLTNDSQEAKRIEETIKNKAGNDLTAKGTEPTDVKPAAETDKN